MIAGSSRPRATSVSRPRGRVARIFNPVSRCSQAGLLAREGSSASAAASVGPAVDDQAEHVQPPLPGEGGGHRGVVERAQVRPADDHDGVAEVGGKVGQQVPRRGRVQRHHQPADALDQQRVAGLLQPGEAPGEGGPVDRPALVLGGGGGGPAACGSGSGRPRPAAAGSRRSGPGPRRRHSPAPPRSRRQPVANGLSTPNPPGSPPGPGPGRSRRIAAAIAQVATVLPTSVSVPMTISPGTRRGVSPSRSKPAGGGVPPHTPFRGVAGVSQCIYSQGRLLRAGAGGRGRGNHGGIVHGPVIVPSIFY